VPVIFSRRADDKSALLIIESRFRSTKFSVCVFLVNILFSAMNLETGKLLWSCLGRAAATLTLVASLVVAETPPDLYIMAMSHQPEFCYQHRSADYVGCQHPMDYWKTHLTIHGLWPEVRGKYCITHSSEKFTRIESFSCIWHGIWLSHSIYY
jgi:hypothetical protein